MNLSHIAILKIKSANYRCLISSIIKRKAINLMQYIELTKNRNIKHKNLLSHIKMNKEILTFGDNEIEKNNKFYHHKISFRQKKL